tara:strand:+ start:459 stop:1241 length:783 start_codon:yes stop_codon:yes gene_type:complete
MKILELFSGSRSIGKVADLKNHHVFSVDNVDYPNTDWTGDILDWDYRLNEMQTGDLDELYIPDMIWASCPCTDFSVACIGKKWVSGHEFKPRDPNLLGIELLNKTIEIIQFYLEKNPDLIWFVENPRGKMRKSPMWKTIEHQRHTVTYCSYGDSRMKPTDIWTNAYNWTPKTMCKNFKYNNKGEVINRHCHHDASQRGSTVRKLRAQGIDAVKRGTESLKNNHERSKIPQELCEEIVSVMEHELQEIRQDGWLSIAKRIL